MSARQAKEGTQRETPPPDLATSTPPVYRGSPQGFDFYLQAIYELQKSMGAVEASVKHLADVSKDHSGQLTTINEEIHSAKGMVKALMWATGGIGAAALLILGTMLTVLLKHFHLL